MDMSAISMTLCNSVNKHMSFQISSRCAWVSTHLASMGFLSSPLLHVLGSRRHITELWGFSWVDTSKILWLVVVDLSFFNFRFNFRLLWDSESAAFKEGSGMTERKCSEQFISVFLKMQMTDIKKAKVKVRVFFLQKIARCPIFCENQDLRDL